MSWKGTKENVSSLPQSGNQVGDLWHINENGNEYAWDGSKWEALGGTGSDYVLTYQDKADIAAIAAQLITSAESEAY